MYSKENGKRVFGKEKEIICIIHDLAGKGTCIIIIVRIPEGRSWR